MAKLENILKNKTFALYKIPVKFVFSKKSLKKIKQKFCHFKIICNFAPSEITCLFVEAQKLTKLSLKL